MLNAFGRYKTMHNIINRVPSICGSFNRVSKIKIRRIIKINNYFNSCISSLNNFEDLIKKQNHVRVVNINKNVDKINNYNISPSKKLKDFLKLSKDVKVIQIKIIIRLFNNYIKKNELQINNYIMLNAELKKLFNTRKNKILFVDLHNHLYKHFYNNSKIN